jgi:general secretion pathway protein G
VRKGDRMRRIGKRAAAGFTLLEIMIVVAIIGILALIIVPQVAGKDDEARVTAAKANLRAVSSALEQYKIDNFNYPSTQQGLEALVRRPSGEPEARNWNSNGYLKEGALKDPWSRPYEYLSPGSGGAYDLYSLGRDGRPGGEGPDADINLDG